MIKLLFSHLITAVLVLLVWELATSADKSNTWSSSGSQSDNRSASPQPEMNAFRAVFVTVPSIEVGKKIAHGLVSNKLAACVNIIPQITSVYEWEGKVNEDNELLLMIKTQADLFDDLEKFVRANHPYTVPEVIAVPIEQGSQPYLDWINKELQKKV